ncbi:MAG: metalloregulator ArsR/SmtB family transcription factor [Bacteroidota bacterium]|nr:metalloregulator ArsR/SmtB family transcription factor [Bacteroidota bacterium]
MDDQPIQPIDAGLLMDMAELLRAIAHPLRISIIELLKDKKQLTVSQIQRELGTEQAVASHHLIILKNKDILNSKRYGKTILYSLRNENISHLIYFARKTMSEELDANQSTETSRFGIKLG